jgi:hypothetical protein
MTVIGIDPGLDTGVAIFKDGYLSELLTMRPFGVAKYLELVCPTSLVVYEDSRIQSNVFTAAKQPRAVALKIARNVGNIDAWCSLIEDSCKANRINTVSISPKAKGAKLDAAQFEAITGWSGSSNQHTRDAAMVAWPFRHGAK